MQRISGTEPQFPVELRAAGRSYLVDAKICVSEAGVVDSVSVRPGSEPALVASVVIAVKGWRYRPLRINGGPPVRFCHAASFKFEPN